MFGDVGGTLKSIVHDYSHFNWIMTGTDMFACEGTSHGEHRDGEWRAGVTHAGPLVRRVRGARLPDPALLHLPRSRLRGGDTARYPWLSADGRDASQPLG